MVRENSFVESMKFLKDKNNEFAKKQERKVQQSIDERNEFAKNYYKIINNRENTLKENRDFLEMSKAEGLSVALKGIYITSLEAGTLTNNGLAMAEHMVDSYIKTKGASKLLREFKGKTYLLNRISEIVEENAETEYKSFIEADSDDDITDPEPKEDDKKEVDKVEPKKDDPDDDKEEVVDKVEDKKEEKSDDGDEEFIDDDEVEVDDTEDSSDNEDEEKSSDDLDNDEDEENIEDDNTEEKSSDDSDNDGVEDGIEDDIETEVDDTGEINYNNKILDDLDKEKDVKKAVAVIKQRIADAEETFIKNNAKDKEQINDLLGKISDNIKTVEDMADNDKEKGKDKVAQESIFMSKQKINEISNNRVQNVLESIIRKFSSSVLKSEVLKESYINEEGSIDMDSIVESSKVIYAWLETLNTLQIEKIDANYIMEVLESI